LIRWIKSKRRRPERHVYVGTLKGVGRVYRQTAIDTYTKVGFAKLQDRKSALTAADMLNDRVIPFFVEDIDHTRTKVKSPQTNGICKRFHKTLLDEVYRMAFRKKVYATIEALQADLDDWVAHDNEARTHQGAGASAKP
jgi:transposase InsO family protein